jgi:asparagine synthase (glutamine-hydrolysing)
MSNTDLVNELDKRLNKVITQESIADVPLGSFLSGGIDSALVTAMLQRNSMRKVETFSLGFEEKKYNEAEHAKKVADHIGTNHHELIVAADDMQDIVPLLPAMFDEPFGDPSAIPTFIVSKFAKSNVTVALTGDGGDELFCGYNHYHRSAQIWSSIQKLPYSLREFSADMLHPLGVKFYSTKHGRKLERLSNYLKCKSMHDCYKVQVEASDTELENLLQAGSKFERIKAPEILQDYDAMMFSDIICYLPDDILAKVDRASMSVSLETRAPFLNHNIVDFAYRLPINCKVKSGNGKLLLRKLLENYIPRNLFERPKMGFGLPIDEWLRGPLRHWAETLLSESNLNEIGFLRTQFIRNRWSLHISGNQNWHYFLWDLLMFLEWYQND